MNKKFIIRKAIAFLVVLCVLFSSCFITINAQDSSELQTMVLIGDESNPNIYGAVRQNSKHIYQGSYSFYSACSTTGGSDYNQWGLRANAQMFDIDFTDYLSNGAIVFWAYVDGDVKGVTKTYNLYLQSNSGFSWNAEWYGFNVSNQFTKSNAWNKIVVPLGSMKLANSGTNKSAVDLTSIKSLSLHTYGGNGITTSTGTGVDIYLDNFIAVSDIDMWEIQNNTIKTTTLLDMEKSADVNTINTAIDNINADYEAGNDFDNNRWTNHNE